MRALVVALLLVGALGAADAHARKPLFLRGGGARNTFVVVGFSEDGTRALLQQKDVARAPGVSAVATSFVVVDAAGTAFEVLVSNVTRTRSGAVIEAVDNALCRERVKALEEALAGFRSVKARAGNCARPTRADVVVEPLKSTPSALTLSEDLAVLQQEVGTNDGLFFVNDDGPLVVVLAVDREDLFGKSTIASTFLRSDPRLNDRWPAP